jgi:hypothetical protein
VQTTKLLALAARKLKFNLDFDGSPRVPEISLDFSADGITHGLRERQIRLSGRCTAPFERTKIGVERRQTDRHVSPFGRDHDRRNESVAGFHYLIAVEEFREMQ